MKEYILKIILIVLITDIVFDLGRYTVLMTIPWSNRLMKRFTFTPFHKLEKVNADMLDEAIRIAVLQTAQHIKVDSGITLYSDDMEDIISTAKYKFIHMSSKE